MTRPAIALVSLGVVRPRRDDVGGEDLPGSARDARHREQRHRRRRVSEGGTEDEVDHGASNERQDDARQGGHSEHEPQESSCAVRVRDTCRRRQHDLSDPVGKHPEELRQRHRHDVQPDILQRQEGCDEHDVDPQHRQEDELGQAPRDPEGQRLAMRSAMGGAGAVARAHAADGDEGDRDRQHVGERRGDEDERDRRVIGREQDRRARDVEHARRSSRGRDDAHRSGAGRHREHHQVQGRADCERGRCRHGGGICVDEDGQRRREHEARRRDQDNDDERMPRRARRGRRGSRRDRATSRAAQNWSPPVASIAIAAATTTSTATSPRPAGPSKRATSTPPTAPRHRAAAVPPVENPRALRRPGSGAISAGALIVRRGRSHCGSCGRRSAGRA